MGAILGHLMQPTTKKLFTTRSRKHKFVRTSLADVVPLNAALQLNCCAWTSCMRAQAAKQTRRRGKLTVNPRARICVTGARFSARVHFIALCTFCGRALICRKQLTTVWPSIHLRWSVWLFLWHARRLVTSLMALLHRTGCPPTLGSSPVTALSRPFGPRQMSWTWGRLTLRRSAFPALFFLFRGVCLLLLVGVVSFLGLWDWWFSSSVLLSFSLGGSSSLVLLYKKRIYKKS